MRTELGQTAIDPEEFAYPEGSLRQSRRKGIVRFSDGKLRTVTLGVPDTFFSIPARACVRGKTVSGYVSVNTETEEFEFRAYTYRKNGNAV